MATITELKTGSQFTGSYESATRKFRAYIANVTLTTNGSGTATIKIGSIGLRKTEGGSVDVLINHGDPRVWAKITQISNSTQTFRPSDTISFTSTVPQNRVVANNVTWTVQQTSSEQVLTIEFYYKKNSGYAWSGESSGTLSVTIPAYSGGSANEVYLTNLLSKRNGSYALTTFSVTGDYTLNSATVAITVNGYTYYDYAPTQSGTSFTSNKYVALGTTDTASVSVSVSVTPTGGTAITLSDSTSISSGSPSVAIDFYSPSPDRYNIGIGCEASENYGNENRTDIAGKLYLNGTEITTGSSDVDDYVTDSGASGSWEYRKWHSGKVEAWYEGTVSVGASSAAGEVFRGNYTLSIPYGIFSYAPYVMCSVRHANPNTFAITGAATSATEISGAGFRTNSTSSSNAISVSIYAWY